MKLNLLLMSIILGLGVYGCGSAPPLFLQTDYEDKAVKSIGILELKEESVLNDEFEISDEDFKSVDSVVIEEVLNRDYDVAAPIIYESYEINSDEDLSKEMIFKICDKEKVDAVLFSSISRYKDDFLGEHSLQMNFKLYKANGDSIWMDQVDLDKNGLVGFLGSVVGITVATAAYPSDGIVGASTLIPIGLAAGVLAGLLVEGVTNHINDAISERLRTLPEGIGEGIRIK